MAGIGDLNGRSGGDGGSHNSAIRALIGALPDPVIVLDQGFVIGLVNRAAVRTFGYAAGELVGKPMSVLVPDVREELEARCKDGSVMSVACSINRVEIDGQSLFVASVRDITKLKGLEARLQEIEGQMRQSQKMVPLGRLAGGIAHDFNNLLTAMRYHASFALESLSEESPARKEILDLDIVAGRAAELTGQLLAFGRRQVLAPGVEGSASKIHPTDRPATPLSTPRLGLRGSETVLIVEDDDTVRRAAARILKSRGYTVITARDGDEGLRTAIGGAQINLLLSDVRMPGMSGPELAGRLSERDPKLAVLLMSGYTGADYEEVAPWPLLPKPFTPQALAQMVREVLDDPEGWDSGHFVGQWA